MDVDNLIERLLSLKYRNESEQVEYHVISSRNRHLVSNEVRKWYEEQNIKATIDIQTKIAELEAKVYAYEKIIANSNFAPILPKWVDYPITCNEKGKL